MSFYSSRHVSNLEVSECKGTFFSYPGKSPQVTSFCVFQCLVWQLDRSEVMGSGLFWFLWVTAWVKTRGVVCLDNGPQVGWSFEMSWRSWSWPWLSWEIMRVGTYQRSRKLTRRAVCWWTKRGCCDRGLLRQKLICSLRVGRSEIVGEMALSLTRTWSW